MTQKSFYDAAVAD